MIIGGEDHVQNCQNCFGDIFVVKYSPNLSGNLRLYNTQQYKAFLNVIIDWLYCNLKSHSFVFNARSLYD